VTQQTVGGVTRSAVQHYDAYGRLKRLFYPEVGSLARFTISYQYGAAGQLTSIADVSSCGFSPDPGDPLPACTPINLWEVLSRNPRMSCDRRRRQRDRDLVSWHVGRRLQARVEPVHGLSGSRKWRVA